jgi:hypothetical protein
MPCGNCAASLGDATLPCPICGEGISSPSLNGSSTVDTNTLPPDIFDFDHQQESNHSQASSATEEKDTALHSGSNDVSVNASLIPGRMRELLRHFRDDLMVSWNEAAIAVIRRRDYNLKIIEDAWNNKHLRHKQLQDDIQGKLDGAKQKLERWRAQNTRKLNEVAKNESKMREELQSIENEAALHLAAQKFDVPQLPSQAPSNLRVLGNLGKAEKQFSIAEASVAQLKEINRPEYWCWTAIDLSVSVPIALLVAVSVSVSLKPEGFGVLLWAFILLSLGILGPIGVLRRGMIIGRVTSKYGEMAQAKHSAEFWILQHLRQAQEEYQEANANAGKFLSDAEEEFRRAMAAEDHSFSLAQKEHQQAVADEEARYQQDLFESRFIFDAQMDEAHHLYDKFMFETGFTGADWNDEWKQWSPAVCPSLCLRLGRLSTGRINVSPLCETGDVGFSLPAITSFLDGRSLLFRYSADTKKQVAQALQSVMLRMLATIPPGKIRFTFIDPVGLGQTVAAFMALGDHEESLITNRAWTEPQHIEQRLSDLTEHMETVIQKYLRNEFATIEEYNNQAQVAEPYRALVVVDFPVNFSDTAARRLVSIAQNGPRCGVHTFIAVDTSKPLPYGFSITDLEQTATVINWNGEEFIWDDDEIRRYPLELDQPPDGDLFKKIIEEVGERAQDAMKVEVPYEKLLQMAQLNEQSWWHNTTTKKIQIPLGPMGARKLQYLSLGEGTAHHTLVVGRPGSGKSNLMHVIITTLALAYSPEEMQLYLIDFKKGVEFNDYAAMRIPHALVIAIESEREFGLSVLQRLDKELQQRGETFRSSGVNSITEYRDKNVWEAIPRILLLVDEFQEFFTQDDNIAREATLILDRLVRQGRAFGIHIMLGSQTLAGSYSLSRSTLDQMAVRIALQCSEADSRLILADDNPAARLLSRPGEAIYNSASGLVEGNSLFQVAMFTKEDRLNHLNYVTKLAKAGGRKIPDPIIFEGNNLARLEECKPLNDLINASNWPEKSKVNEAFLGEPIAIRQPTAARFRRQGGSHLLIVARDESQGTGMLASSVISLAIQQQPADARFFIVDLSSADSPWANLFEDLAGLLPHYIQVFGRRDLQGLLKKLATQINERLEAQWGGEQTLYLVIQGLQRARDLRVELSSYAEDEEDSSTPNELLVKILREGPDVGVHALMWCDTYPNVARILSGRVMAELGQRVATAMSGDDSSQLLDDMAASKLDKPHRAIFYDEEHPGYLEKFRPYAIPESRWVEQITETLRARANRCSTQAGGAD